MDVKTTDHNCGNLRPAPETFQHLGSKWVCPVQRCGAVYVTARITKLPGFTGMIWKKLETTTGRNEKA